MFTFRPHQIVVDPVTHAGIVKQLHNFVCVLSGPEKLYIQHGQVFAHGGDPIPKDQLPQWFWDQVSHLTREAREEVEFLLPTDSPTLDQRTAEVLAAFRRLPLDVQTDLLTVPEVSSAMAEEAATNARKAPQIFDESEDTDEDEDTPETILEPVRLRALKVWVCDQCQAEVPTIHKGLHIARFRRLGRCK